MSVADAETAWATSNNTWAEVDSPDLSAQGYGAASEAKVASQTVGVSDKDATVNVYYDHDTTPVTPDDPQKPDDPINPKNPMQPTTPIKPIGPDGTTTSNTPNSKQDLTNNSRNLPTTGDQTNGFLATLGAVILSLLSVLTFGYISKAKKEN